MWQLLGGAVLLVAGIVGLVETESHRPAYLCHASPKVCESGGAALVPDPGTLGEPTYQILEAVAGLLIVAGVILMMFALLQIIRPRRTPPN
jgi:hypothetical protein